MKYSEKISHKLNDLLTLTYDAKRGFTLAADKVDNSAIEKFLREKADQRETFAQELRSEILTYGDLPEDSGSVKGDFHRAWMSFLSTVSSNEEEKMLDEVERGEKKILNAYRDILENKEWILPNSTRDLLNKQRGAIEKALQTSRMYEEIVS